MQLVYGSFICCIFNFIFWRLYNQTYSLDFESEMVIAVM